MVPARTRYAVRRVRLIDYILALVALNHRTALLYVSEILRIRVVRPNLLELSVVEPFYYHNVLFVGVLDRLGGRVPQATGLPFRLQRQTLQAFESYVLNLAVDQRLVNR